MRPIARRHEATLAQLAIAWTFHQSAVTHVLVGTRDAEQAWENAEASEIRLARDDLEAVARLIDEHAALPA